ncbi:hypothetical protein [Kitasatospora sp. NPDC057015]
MGEVAGAREELDGTPRTYAPSCRGGGEPAVSQPTSYRLTHYADPGR